MKSVCPLVTSGVVYVSELHFPSQCLSPSHIRCGIRIRATLPLPVFVPESHPVWYTYQSYTSPPSVCPLVTSGVVYVSELHFPSQCVHVPRCILDFQKIILILILIGGPLSSNLILRSNDRIYIHYMLI